MFLILFTVKRPGNAGVEYCASLRVDWGRGRWARWIRVGVSVTSTAPGTTLSLVAARWVHRDARRSVWTRVLGSYMGIPGK